MRGWRPGTKEALLDATPGCLTPAAEAATLGAQTVTPAPYVVRQTAAAASGLIPRQLRQSSRNARASKGMAAGMWESSGDVVSTCSTRLAGGRLCLPRSHFAS